MNILIAESNDIISRGLHQLLLDHFPDASVKVITTIAECKPIQEHDYNFVIIEPLLLKAPYYHLPDHISSKCPIIIYTKLPQANYALKFFSLGVMAYLPKRSTVEEIILAITNTLKGRRYVNNQVREQLFNASAKIKNK